MITPQSITNAVNFYENKAQTAKKSDVRAKEKDISIKRTDTSEGHLSAKAKLLLEDIRKKYKDYDIMAAGKGTDKKALLQKSRKEFAVVFSNEELEKMAADEAYAGEKLRTMEKAVEMSKRIAGELTANGEESNKASIHKIGISFNEDGSMTLFAELEKVSESQQKYLDSHIEKRKSQKAEEKKKAKDSAEEKEVQKAEEEKAAERKKKAASIKKATVQATTEEELIEKIENFDWNKVIEETVGARFDFSI